MIKRHFGCRGQFDVDLLAAVAPCVFFLVRLTDRRSSPYRWFLLNFWVTYVSLVFRLYHFIGQFFMVSILQFSKVLMPSCSSLRPMT
ncbi:hypothetical protein L208DRAFT_930503 [Tricholoma matsutake]|nr:hypothetical protein L208DRAFT_930503 [Tricholoma matsutake 945]